MCGRDVTPCSLPSQCPRNSPLWVSKASCCPSTRYPARRSQVTTESCHPVSEVEDHDGTPLKQAWGVPSELVPELAGAAVADAGHAQIVAGFRAARTLGGFVHVGHNAILRQKNHRYLTISLRSESCRSASPRCVRAYAVPRRAARPRPPFPAAPFRRADARAGAPCSGRSRWPVPPCRGSG